MSGDIPEEILEDLKLKEPEEIPPKIIKVIYDKKHKKQFSIKFPSSIIEDINLIKIKTFKLTVKSLKPVVIELKEEDVYS